VVQLRVTAIASATSERTARFMCVWKLESEIHNLDLRF
jgi:hypothetical protein